MTKDNFVYFTNRNDVHLRGATISPGWLLQASYASTRTFHKTLIIKTKFEMRVSIDYNLMIIILSTTFEGAELLNNTNL